MSSKLERFQQKVEEIMTETEASEVKDFTFNLISLVWSEVCGIPNPEIDENTAESMIMEVEQSIEIMNPELKEDKKLLEDVLNSIKLYKESE